MGDVAASGGYFISMAADVIVAQPGTLTGSIDVLSGKPVVGELLGRYGVSTDTVTAGEHAAMFGTTHPYSEDEWALVNRWLDHIYADFTGKVAKGRGMTAERVHELARGRVWTGPVAGRAAGDLPGPRLPAEPADRPAAPGDLQRGGRRGGSPADRGPARGELGPGVAAGGRGGPARGRPADPARGLV